MSFSPGIPSQAEGRAEEAEGDAGEGSREGAPGWRWDQEVREEIRRKKEDVALTD